MHRKSYWASLCSAVLGIEAMPTCAVHTDMPTCQLSSARSRARRTANIHCCVWEEFCTPCPTQISEPRPKLRRPLLHSCRYAVGYMAPEIMSSFFTGAAELARRSRDAALARRSKDAAKHQQATPAIKSQQPSQQPPAGAAAVAAATATRTLKPCSSGIAAATADKAGKKGAELPSSSTSGMKRTGSSSSLKRSASATALAELAAAASKAAAAVPGGSNISRSLAAVAAAVGLPDAAAEAELEVVPTYDGEKADVYR